MSAQPEVVVEESAAQLASAAASRTLDVLIRAQQVRGDAHLVVTGGGILEAVLAELVRPGADAPEWSQVHIWWGDERYVPADSPDRNDKPAFAKAFAALPLDPAKIHRMPASDAGFGDDVEAAAASYAAELAAARPEDGDVPHFDVVLLGVGPDGHCCSLFPHHPGLDVTDASVIAVHDSPKPPPIRLSLTFPTLAAAEQIWFIASGAGKADAVAQAVGGADRHQIPSAGARGRAGTVWLVDRDAAAKLPSV